MLGNIVVFWDFSPKSLLWLQKLNGMEWQKLVGVPDVQQTENCSLFTELLFTESLFMLVIYWNKMKKKKKCLSCKF